MKKGDMQLDKIDIRSELRELGVRATFYAGNYFIMHGTTEWTPEFSAKVAALLTRYGMREHSEGLWVQASATPERIREMEQRMHEDDEYRRTYEAVTDHPDWSDQEIADAYHVPVEEVENIRNR